MKGTDAETVERAALRADIRRFASRLGRNYALALALVTFSVLAGAALAWFAFQASIATSAGFWYLTSSYVAAGVGALTLAVVWAVTKILRFIGRRAE